MLTTRIICALILSVVFAAVAAHSQAPSPAENKARELARVISLGSRAEAKKYVEANFGGNMANMPMDMHLTFFSSIYDMSRGFDVEGVQDAKPNQATLLVKHKLTGTWDALFVAVEDKEPFKIVGVGLRQPKPPASALKRLSEKEIGHELESFMKKLAEADAFSGTVLLAKDGKPVYQGAFGAANKDFDVPNKIDTKFNLGSMNKMFTAVAIAQLVERGKLSFDDPLSKFIPDFPDAASAQKIQIKHLLSHTAGLGGYFSKRYNDMSRAKLRTLDDMMALARQDEKLQLEPGTKWQYSNTGMLVLGKVIEIVSGQTYYDYISENITKAAAMTNTGCFELDKVNANLAVGYDKQYSDSGVTFTNNIFEHVMRGGPQGGCYSTVGDLLRFDQALRSNKLVKAETFKTLATAKPELKSPNYGFGFQVNSQVGTVGHGGGFLGINSNLAMYLDSGWTAIVMSNYSRGAQAVNQKMSALVNANGNSARALSKN